MSGWDRIVGHDWAVQLLSTAVKNGRIGHAYLITGPEQIGKTTLARTFAQALNCEQPLADRPCSVCRSCRLIAQDHHPDVHLLLPEISERGKPSIKVDQIRDLQRQLQLSTIEGRYRVAILKQFDSANPSAANAFLKTLEEPPPSVVLLLTAADADSLLPTIASRCRTVNLRPMDKESIEQNLMADWGVHPKEALLLASLADGRPGWAIEASKEADILKTRQKDLSQLHEALEGKRVRRFALADKLSRKPEHLPLLLRTWLSWWRDLALVAYGQGPATPSVPISNIDQQPLLEELAGKWSLESIVANLAQTGRAIQYLAQNANTRLVMENLLLAYPLPGDKVKGHRADRSRSG
ncbi:MAG: DNA polymerase III subunit delta' [Candidatus Promineifilaceae bacterium]|jgi:DNA polymerase-3 subunit delta'